jgi:uroporphyrinogen-III synthase
MEKVLITRPADSVANFADKVAALGYQPILAPLIELAPTGVPLPAEDISAIIITSKAAVRFINPDENLLRTPVYAVGATTMEACLKRGFSNVVFGGGNVENLLKNLIKDFSNTTCKRLLYLSGSEISRDLCTLLQPWGVEVIRVPVYVSKSLRLADNAIRLLCGDEIAWITLFSSRTAAILAADIQRLETRNWTSNVSIACLAPGIAQVIGDIRWRKIEIARQPTQAALLECLAKR